MSSRRRYHAMWLCSTLVVVLGGLAIAGEVLRVALVTMPMTAAVASLAVGASLLLLREPSAPPRRVRLAHACALLATAIGLATLVEHLADVDLGIDQLVVRAAKPALHAAAPGRMAPLSALSFVLAGLALVALDARTRMLRAASQILANAVLFVAFSALTGYVLGVRPFHIVLGMHSMAIHVVSVLALFAIAILLARPQRGLVAALSQANPVGTAMRGLLLLSAATLTAIAGLRLTGQWAGLYSAELGTALAAAVGMMFVALFTVWYAANQRATEQVHRQAVRDERFLSELGYLLRGSARRTGDVLARVSASLGEYLGVTRCLFIEIDAVAGQATVRDDYHDGVASLAGTHALSSWRPELLAAGYGGKTAVSDAANDGEWISEHEPAAPRPSAACSYVAVPLQRHGGWVSTLLASAVQSHTWRPHEIALIQSVAERTWLWHENDVALEALREREQHLAAILDSAFDGIVSTDQVGRIVEFNRSAERIFGHRRDEALGRPMAELLFPASPPDIPCLAPAAASTSVSAGIQLPARRADGTEIAVEITVAQVQDCEPPQFAVLIRDVTERRRAMDQLLLAIEAAPTGMILVDRNGKIALVNAQLENLFGYPRDQLVGKPVELLVPDRVRRQHPELREAFLGDPRFHTMGAGRELFGLHRDGREIPVTIALNPFHMETGKFVLSSVVDITERKRAEQALRESEERLRMAQQIAQIGTFEWNIETGSITWTTQLEAMHGLAPGGFPGTQASWDRMIHVDDLATMRRGMGHAFDTDEVAEAEWRIVWPDGTIRWLAGRWKVFRNESGKPRRLTGINIDLTERKHVEQERECLVGQLGALNTELERRVEDRTAQLTVALKEREVLLQEVHHRVKNNLQIISSLIRLQTRKISGVDNRREMEECRNRVDTIALIHEQLYQAKDHTQVAFSDYVKNLVSNVFRAATIASTVRLDVNIESIALPVDKAIPCGLILNELVTNALKHAFPGGRRGAIGIGLRLIDEGDVVLEVHDDGVGMAVHVAPATSTALGLRLIDMLIKQLRGRFDVIRGNGTRFRIVFPLANGDTPRSETLS